MATRSRLNLAASDTLLPKLMDDARLRERIRELGIPMEIILLLKSELIFELFYTTQWHTVQ
jgi:hypothetical protein